MIQIQVTPEHRYTVLYRMDGVVCSVVDCGDLTVALSEVKQKMQLMMGLAKGKTFCTPQGRH